MALLFVAVVVVVDAVAMSFSIVERAAAGLEKSNFHLMASSCEMEGVSWRGECALPSILVFIGVVRGRIPGMFSRARKEKRKWAKGDCRCTKGRCSIAVLDASRG